MTRILVMGLVGALLGGGLGVLMATVGDEGEIFIASDHPVTTSQVQDKLGSDGWLNIQITEHGRYLEVAASKGGQPRKMMVDTITGRLIAGDED
jgi:hypothetical protein